MSSKNHKRPNKLGSLVLLLVRSTKSRIPKDPLWVFADASDALPHIPVKDQWKIHRPTSIGFSWVTADTIQTVGHSHWTPRALAKVKAAEAKTQDVLRVAPLVTLEKATVRGKGARLKREKGLDGTKRQPYSGQLDRFLDAFQVRQGLTCKVQHADAFGAYIEIHGWRDPTLPVQGTDLNIRRLWHGTAPGNWVSILHEELKPSTRGLLGPGIYFGEEEKASHFLRGGLDGYGLMFEANVALGRCLEMDGTLESQRKWSDLQKGWGPPPPLYSLSLDRIKICHACADHRTAKCPTQNWFKAENINSEEFFTCKKHLALREGFYLFDAIHGCAGKTATWNGTLAYDEWCLHGPEQVQLIGIKLVKI